MLEPDPRGLSGRIGPEKVYVGATGVAMLAGGLGAPGVEAGGQRAGCAGRARIPCTPRGDKRRGGEAPCLEGGDDGGDSGAA